MAEQYRRRHNRLENDPEDFKTKWIKGLQKRPPKDKCSFKLIGGSFKNTTDRDIIITSASSNNCTKIHQNHKMCSGKSPVRSQRHDGDDREFNGKPPQWHSQDVPRLQKEQKRQIRTQRCGGTVRYQRTDQESGHAVTSA